MHSADMRSENDVLPSSAPSNIIANRGDFDNETSAVLKLVQSESDGTLVSVQSSQAMTLWSPTFSEPNLTFCSLDMDSMYEGLSRC
jgi:hypothetical protein